MTNIFSKLSEVHLHFHNLHQTKLCFFDFQNGFFFAFLSPFLKFPTKYLVQKEEDESTKK